MPPPSVPLDAIRQPAALYDTGGRIVAVNDLAEALVGRPLAGLTADQLASLFDVRSMDGAPFADAGPTVARALAGEVVVDLPCSVTLVDGTRHEVLATASPVREGDAVAGALVLWRDVTAWVRAEDAVQALFTASPDIVLLLDADGTLRALNETTAREFGRPAAELVGTSIWEVMHPDVVSFRREQFNAALRSGRPLRFEEFGNGRWFDTIVEPILSGAGEVTEVAIISRDITARKRAEEALQQSEKRLQLILDRSLDALYRRDLASGRDEYYTRAIEAMTGFSVEDCLAMPVDEIAAHVHPDDLASVISEKIVAASGREEGTVDYRFLCRDGTYRWFSDRFRVERDGNGRPVSWEGVIRDINARKEVERALGESEERLRLAQEGAGIAIWDRDAATDRVTVAPGFLRRYLLDPEALATYSDWIRYVHTDDRERLESARRAAFATGGPLDIEFRIVIPSGEVRWLHIKVRGVTDEGGALSRVLGVILDVTDRKRAEEAMAESDADARSFFESMVDPCAICEMVVDGRGEPADIRLVDVNPAFVRTLRLPAPLIVGQTAFMILPTLHREWLDLFLEVSREGGFVEVEEPFPALDRRFHVTGFPVRNGRVAVVFRDITAG